MNTYSKERTLQWIKNQYNKGNISFSHKLQRPIGQWNTKMRSLLIHSLLANFPVNPIYIVQENNILYTLDGSQRTYTCISYLNNEFSLSKNTPNINLTFYKDGQTISKEYIIAGKRYSQLDEELQNTLSTCSLTFCTIADYTDDDIKEMFRRQNSGKPLNNKQIRIIYESDLFSSAVYSLATHPFMKKIMSNTQQKNGTDRDLIIQALMLIESGNTQNFLSFRSKDIDSFILNHSPQIDNNIFENLQIAMNELDKAFENVKIPVTSIAMILYSTYTVLREGKSFTDFIEIVKDFLKNYDNNEIYKMYVLEGTSSRENVKGRFDWWCKAIENINTKNTNI